MAVSKIGVIPGVGLPGVGVIPGVGIDTTNIPTIQDNRKFVNEEDWSSDGEKQKEIDDQGGAEEILKKNKDQEDSFSFAKLGDQIAKNWLPQNKDVYKKDQSGNIMLDEKGNPVPLDDTSKAFNLASKYTIAPIKTLWNIISPVIPVVKNIAENNAKDIALSAGVTEEQLAKHELYKQQQKQYEEQNNNADTILQTQKYLNTEGKIDLGLFNTKENKLKEFETYKKDNGLDSFEMDQKTIEEKLVTLGKDREDAVSKNDTETIKLIDQEIEKQNKIRNKALIKLGLGIDVEGDTTADVISNAKSKLGGSYTTEQITTLINKNINKKITEANGLYQEYLGYAANYQDRSDKNIVKVTPNSIKKSIEFMGVPMDDVSVNEMFGSTYSGMQETIDSAREKGGDELKKTRIQAGILNDLVEHTFKKIFIENGDAYASKRHFSDMLNSEEFQGIKNYIMSGDMNNYYDDKGNLNVEKYMNDIHKTDTYTKYAGKLDVLATQAEQDKKEKHIDDATTIAGQVWNTIAAAGNKYILKPTHEAYNSYDDVVQKYGENSTEAKRWLRVVADSAAQYSDEFIVGEKQKDITYMNNPMKRAWDSLSLASTKVTSNPTETAAFLATFALPFIGTAGKIEAGIEAAAEISSIQSPFLRAMANVGKSVAGEVVEGGIMNLTIDSFGGSESDISLNLLDAGIGVIKSIGYIKEGFDIMKTKKTIDTISSVLKDSGIEVGSKKYVSILKNELEKVGYMPFLRENGQTISEFIQDGKIKYADLTESLHRGRVKLLSSINPKEEIQLQQIKDLTESGIMNNTQKQYIYKQAEKAYGADFGDIITKYSKGGAVDTDKVIARFLSDRMGTLQQLEAQKGLVGIVELAKKTGISKTAETEYKKIISILDSAKKANPEKAEAIESMKVLASERYAESRLLPLYISQGAGSEAYKSLENKTIELNKMASSLGLKAPEQKTIDLLSDMPKEIIDNLNDPQKLAEIIFGNEQKYNSVGIKTYNVSEYIKNNEKFLVDSIGKKGFGRLSNIMGTINDLNNGNLKIYELPQSIREMIGNVSGFTTFVKNGEDVNMVIGTFGGLVDIIKNTEKLGVSSNLEYVKMMTHEIGHNILLSLKPKVKESLFKYINTVLGVDISESKLSKILQKANPDRIKFLMSLRGRPEILLEEISADMISDGIYASINGRVGSADDIGKIIMAKVSKGEVADYVSNSSSPFDVLGKNFVNMIESLYTRSSVTKSQKELKGIMYYMAANILEGNKQWASAEQQAKNIIDLGSLSYSQGGHSYKTIEGAMYKKMSDVEDEAKRLAGKNKYTLSGLYKDGNGNYRGDLDITLPIKEEKESQLQPKLVYMYQEEGEKQSTLIQGLNSFYSAKLYSENIVREALSDAEYTSESLGTILSLSFGDVGIQHELLKGYTQDSPEFKKFVEAMEFAQSKHGIAISNLQKFMKNGKVDMMKKIDGKTFNETLLNVSSRITKDGVVEFAGQDLIKFLNISDKESYNKIAKLYFDSITTHYDTKVLTKVEGILDRAGAKGDTFSEKYIDMMNKVEKKIYDTALNGSMDPNAIKQAEDISKDVVSRLFIGAPGYIGTFNKIQNTDNMSRFIDELAFGLVRKNKAKSSSSFYNNLYDNIIMNFEDAALDVNKCDNFASVLSKENIEGGIEFSRSYQEKSFFNFLSARGNEFIHNALKDAGISELKIDTDTFARFIEKVSVGSQSRYEIVIANKMSELGLLEGLNLSSLAFGSSKADVIKAYKEALQKNKSLIVDDDYNVAVEYLNSLEKDGLSKKDLKFFLDDNSGKMSSYGKGLTLDGFFRDIMTKEQIMESRKIEQNRLMGIAGIKPTKEVIDAVDIIDSPKFDDALGVFNSYMADYSNLVSEIKSEGMAEAGYKIINNDMLKPFFNIEGSAAKLKTVVLDGYNKKIKIEFDNNLYKTKGNWLTQAIGFLVNPATVAEGDKFIANALQSAIDTHSQTFKVYDGPIKNILVKRGETAEYISKATFNQILQEELKENIKKGLTYNVFSEDVANAYAKKYYRKGVYTYRSEVEGYRDLVDGYVEMLSKNHPKNGYYKATFEGDVEKTNELRLFFKEIGESNSGKLFNGSRSMSVEADKMLGLGGYWLDMSTDTIKKLKDKSAAFHPKMFNNFLYKSFASTESVYNRIDGIMKIGRNIEGGLAKAQYAMFYSIFGTGIASMSQQQISNTIHLFAKQASEFGLENIDKNSLDEFLTMVEGFMPSELTKSDIFESRPELTETISGQKKGSKLGRSIDWFLQNQSSLAWSDKSVETSVKNYSLASSLIEAGYTGKGAKEFMDNMINITNEFSTKGYDKYISMDRLLRFGDNPKTINGVASLINKEVENGTMTMEEGRVILSDISSYSQSMQPLREVTHNARMKTITFFQMSKTPELVQNMIGGMAGTANMRFMNRASRKAGDYGYKLGNAILNKDMTALTKIVSQITAEGMYASKVYMYINDTSEGGADYQATMGALWLPYVVMNMSTLSAVDNIIGSLKGNDATQYMSAGEKLSAAVYDIFYNFGQKFQGRLGTTPLYWASQIIKIKNGLSKLSENTSLNDVYSTKVAGIPVVNAIAEIFANIFQNRIGRFNTDTSSGIYRNYLSNSNKNYFLNFLSNAKITNDIVGADKLKTAFYDIMKAEEDGTSFALQILGYSEDAKFSARAFDNFYKNEGLEQLNGGSGVLEILDKINGQSDTKDIEKASMAAGIPYSELKAIDDENMKTERSEEGITQTGLNDLSTVKYKPFKLVVAGALMKTSEGDKALIGIGEGITTEEKKEYTTKVNDMIQKVKDKILDMEKSNPKLIKAAAYDQNLWSKDIVSGLNTFGEQQRIGIILTAMSNAKRAIVKEQYKLKNGKDWYKKNSKTDQFKIDVETECAAYDRDLLANNYNTIVMGNQTIPQTLQFLYTTTSKDTPLKNNLTKYSTFGTYLGLSLIEKNITSQGLSSIGYNNPLAERNALLWNYYDQQTPEKKEEVLTKILAFKNAEVTHLKYSDPVLAEKQKAGIAISDINRLVEIGKDPELLDKMKDGLKTYLDAVTVSKPLTEDTIMKNIETKIFKTPGTKKAKKIHYSFSKIADDLTKFIDFKNEFYKSVLKQTPIDNIEYSVKGSSITPLKLGTGEAKKKETEYQFIKIKAPESEKTPDIVVETIKTSKPSGKYTPKSIKGQNVYIVKSTKGRK